MKKETAIEIYQTRKQELIEKTLKLMPTSLIGDRANRTFYFEVDKETGELTVDYLYYLGQQYLSNNCFFTIHDHETPSPEDFGYENFEDMDFAACGFDEQIGFAIDNKLAFIS